MKDSELSRRSFIRDTSIAAATTITAARASYTLPLGQTAADRRWLETKIQEQWANLPQQYAWLREWQKV